MIAILEVMAYNRPGVLDRITGLIRRQGWNIENLHVGYGSNGLMQITLSITGRSLDIEALGEHLADLHGIHSWRQISPEKAIVREMLLLHVPVKSALLKKVDGLRVIERGDGMLYAEFTGTPQEVEIVWSTAQEEDIYCARKGAIILPKERGAASNE